MNRLHVGVNLFARGLPNVRINSHLRRVRPEAARECWAQLAEVAI
jgi:hypothetical protein